MAKTFRKLQVTNFTTDFEKAVEIKEEPIPVPKAGQALVRNLYAGVNATDINITAGRYFVTSPPPFDIGFETVGVIDSVGEGVTLKSGQPVIYLGSKGYSEYCLAEKHEIIPVNETNAEYLQLALVGLSASIGLDEVGRIKKGETVLITAAAGGTGMIAVQWAKIKGCHVIGTCSSDEKAAFLKSIGCDFVIDYKKENIDEVLTKNYPNGVNVIWETIGGQMTATLFKHLSRKGRMVLLGSITQYKTEGITGVQIPNLTTELIMGSKQLLGFLFSDYLDNLEYYMMELITKYKSGELKVKIDNGAGTPKGPFKGLADVARAVNHLHSGKNCGKVLVEL